MKTCVVCGRNDAGMMRRYKGNWYCDGGSSGTNHNNCFSERFSEKSTMVGHVEVEVICPHCGYDVSEVWNKDGVNYDVCPGCGAEFYEGYEEEVSFIKPIIVSTKQSEMK